MEENRSAGVLPGFPVRKQTGRRSRVTSPACFFDRRGNSGHKKSPGTVWFRGMNIQRLALAELGSATSGFEAVLKCSYVRFSLRFRAFRAFPLKVAPLFNHKMGTSDARFYCRNASFTTLTSSSGLLYFT